MASLKEAQEKVMQYQMLNERIKMLDSRRQMLLSKIVEVDSTIEAVKELEKDEQSEIILPLGSGVFVNGTVKDKNKMLVMLSRAIAVDMNIEKARETLDKNKKTLENGLQIIEGDMAKIEQEMIRLEPEVRSFFEKQQQLSQSQ